MKNILRSSPFPIFFLSNFILYFFLTEEITYWSLGWTRAVILGDKNFAKYFHLSSIVIHLDGMRCYQLAVQLPMHCLSRGVRLATRLVGMGKQMNLDLQIISKVDNLLPDNRGFTIYIYPHMVIIVWNVTLLCHYIYIFHSILSLFIFIAGKERKINVSKSKIGIITMKLISKTM